MKREKRKKPSDYPQIAFRVSEDEKELISKHIEEAHELLNKSQPDDAYRIKKNEIAVNALILGLTKIKKQRRLVQS